MKYEEWLTAWLENYIKPMRKARTVDLYTQIVKKKIIPRLGRYRLNELTPIIIQRFITRLSQCGNERNGKGLASNTVNGIVSVIQGSLQTAYRLGYVSEYVGDRIIRPKAIEKRVECFSLSEQKAIEQAALKNKAIKLRGVVISLYTGLRIGELLALTWSDVHFCEKEIIISKSCYCGRHGRIIGGVKTESSIRSIPMCAPVIKILREMKDACKSEYVISSNGKPVKTRAYQKNFELLLKRAGIKHRGFHALRHTFATRALECGMDVKTLSEIMGHKNSSVTLNRYAHCLSEHKKAMMNKLGKTFE